jgi:hypothetical protein
MSAVEAVARHGALVAAALSLGAIGWRVATRAGATGLVRLVAAVTLGATLAVLTTLVLGLIGLGSSPIALTLAAVLEWLAVRTAVPAPRIDVGRELDAWWAKRTPVERVGLAAGGGALAGWIVWQLRYPYISTDGLTYHLPLVASWTPDGNVGAPSELVVGVPFGNYPITHEVLLAWATGIAGSWAPALVAAPLLLLLLVCAAWAGFRELGADRLTAGLATAAIAALPIVIGQLNAVGTDLAALTWLSVLGALAAASATRPALLPFVLLAAGLAVGTKTTTVVIAAVVVAFALWGARHHLRSAARPLGAAALAALATGAVWPLRNLIEHGSPLWPFQAWPGGDPIPPVFERLDEAFIDHPGAMLDGRVDEYLERLAGGTLLVAAALVLPLIARDRRALIASAAVLVGLFSWVSAPYTGITESTELAVGATRYLLPCFAAAVVAVTLSARGRAYALALAVLAFATAWSLVRDLRLGFPLTPGLVTLIVPGAVAGLVALRLPRRWLRWAVPALAVASTVGLAAAASGVAERHTRVAMYDAPLLDALTQDPSFDADGRDMAMTPATLGLAAGDELQHDLQLIPGREPCPAVRRRLTRGWVIIQIRPPTATAERMRACLHGIRPVHVDPTYELYD